MSEDLKHQAKKAVYWSAITNISNQGMQFVIGIVLARLLSPEDFGVIALPTIFLAVAQCFIDSGFSSALVRKPDLKEEDLSTAFYFNVCVGVSFYTLLFFCSPLIADFYETPILKDILRVTALSTLFGPLQSVHFAQFSRKMDFKTPAKISIACKLTTGLVGIALAYKGWGIWALVFQGVASQLLSLVLVWFLSPWRPKTGWSNESFKYLFGFGSRLLTSSILDTLYNNIIPTFLGKFCSARDLGLFNRGYGYAQLPCNQLNGMIGPIAFPMFCKLASDSERLARYFRRLIRLVIYTLAPINILMIVIARPLVLTLITEKWEDCIIVVQIMAFSIIFWPLQSLNMSLFSAIGRSDMVLKSNVVVKIIGLSSLLVSLPFGLVVICASGVFRAVLNISWVAYYAGKVTEFGLVAQWREVLKPLSLAMITGVFTYVLLLYIDGNVFQIVMGSLVFCLIYILLSLALKLNEFTDILYLLHIKKDKNGFQDNI